MCEDTSVIDSLRRYSIFNSIHVAVLRNIFIMELIIIFKIRKRLLKERNEKQNIKTIKTPFLRAGIHVT